MWSTGAPTNWSPPVADIEITHEMVEAYHRGRDQAPSTGASDWTCTTRGLREVAPLIATQACDRQHCDALCGDVLDDRDAYLDWADKLARAIATAAGVDIGEHSNLNQPWERALGAVPLIAAQALRQAVGEIRAKLVCCDVYTR